MRAEVEQGLISKYENLQKEKDNLEHKLYFKRIESNELEQKLAKQVANAEKNSAVLEEKLSNLDRKYNELKEKYNKDLDIAVLSKDQFSTQLYAEKQRLEAEISNLKESLDRTEAKNYELKLSLEKEKLLWENKYGFLEKEKESYKKDQNSNASKYQESLEILQAKSRYDLEKMEKNYKSLMETQEKNFTLKIEESLKTKDLEICHLQTLIAELEKQMKARERNTSFSDKQLDSVMSSKLRDLETEVEEKGYDLMKMKTYYEGKLADLQANHTKEKDQLKKRSAEIEKRLSEIETRRSLILLEFEKEKTKYNFEIDRLQSQIRELEEANADIKAKYKSKLRETENKSRSKIKTGGTIGTKGASSNLNPISGGGVYNNKFDFKEYMTSKEKEKSFNSSNKSTSYDN